MPIVVLGYSTLISFWKYVLDTIMFFFLIFKLQLTLDQTSARHNSKLTNLDSNHQKREEK